MDRIVFDELVRVLVLRAAYTKVAHSSRSATTIRTRSDERIAVGEFQVPGMHSRRGPNHKSLLSVLRRVGCRMEPSIDELGGGTGDAW